MQSAKASKSMKKLLHVERSTGHHWVGDGFPVQTLFSYSNLGAAISPFLLFDYAGPAEFTPTEQRRGVGSHPHRGFETVTIVYSGEVEHRDSSGGGGKIGPGDVQWMTAASGLVHEEFHGHDFTRQGGMLEMVQLWINLPARDKMSPPHYQSISNSQIPAVNLPDKQGVVRVIAGQFDGVEGPARTFTPVNVWDVRLDGAHQTDFAVPDGYTTLLAVLKGSLRIASGDTASQTLGAAEIARFDPVGDHIRIESAQNATALLLSGEPIREPIVGSGPFVMNSTSEIHQAMVDYRSGKMGHMG